MALPRLMSGVALALAAFGGPAAAQEGSGVIAIPSIVVSEAGDAVVLEARVTGGQDATGTVEAVFDLSRLAGGSTIRTSQAGMVDFSEEQEATVGRLQLGGDTFDRIEAVLTVSREGTAIARATLLLGGLDDE